MLGQLFVKVCKIIKMHEKTPENTVFSLLYKKVIDFYNYACYNSLCTKGKFCRFKEKMNIYIRNAYLFIAA